VKYCTRCVTPDTRPRLTFDKDGVCSACQWHEDKQTKVNWKERRKSLESLCNKFRGHGYFNVIVPCSGGKDGTYVAWKLKHEFDMNPLCVTFYPQMQTPIGQTNLENFKASGFNHITLSPDAELYRKIATVGFIEQGRPKLPFVTGISTAIFRLSALYDVPFIMYGEEGEKEYGGAVDAREKIDRRYLVKYYYSGIDPAKHGWWWQLPQQDDLDRIYATHWSKFEDWDPQDHARLAKDKCGFEMLVGGSIGTFTNYAQLDDVLQDLHTYMMFIKFGFGRCTSDASIEIRRGRMTREQGVNVVNQLDGLFPVEYLGMYLDYFEMTEKEFWEIIDRWVNHDILHKTGKPEKPYALRDTQCV